MFLLCVVAFSVLHITQALLSPRHPRIMTGEEVQQNEEMKMANLLLHLLQAKMVDKEEAAISRQDSGQEEIVCCPNNFCYFSCICCHSK